MTTPVRETSTSIHHDDNQSSVQNSSTEEREIASSPSPDTPTRRSRRRRNRKAAMENNPTGRILQIHHHESAWGNESQLLEDALSSATSSSHQMEDDAMRRFAVDHLEKLLAQWSPSEASSNPWQRTRPTLITFGSYRLGVHRADSDLDVLALCPPEFTRADFFLSWVELLKADSRISRVHPIPQAYTPVIKFYFNENIQIDMLFARVADGTKLRQFQQQRVSPALTMPDSSSHANNTTTKKEEVTIPKRIEYSIDDSDLKEQDEAGVRSLNGARVSQMLLEMVPDLTKFRIVLRAVKEWAVAKGIYSNVLGFLGGVNFAILVAWICQEYPNAGTPALLRNFFRTFATWTWPAPVALLPIQSTPPEGAPLMPAWDPQRYPRDGLHIMPIVTPAYPSMNSSYNVAAPQLRRIQEEMNAACNVLSSAPQPPPSIRKGTSAGSKSVFSRLFEPSDFFSWHEHFLQITIRASNEQDFLEWFRLVESRLRLLIGSMETPELHVWPYSHYFERKYDADGNASGEMGRSEKDCLHESLFFIALRFADGIDTFSLVPLTSDFLYKVNSWPGRRIGMDLSLSHVVADQLPDFIPRRKLPKTGWAGKENNSRYHNQWNNGNGYYNNNGGKKKNHNRRNSRGNNNDFSHRQRQADPHPQFNVSRSHEDDTHLPAASSSSSDRAETEETQSMASDISFAESSCSSSTSGASACGNSSPIKRICVFEHPGAGPHNRSQHLNTQP